MSIPLPDVKILWACSGNRCAMCFGPLSSMPGSEAIPYVIGEQAHNKGEHAGNEKAKASARYDSSQDPVERNSYTNLILLCPTCHTIIDKDEGSYSVDRLTAIKSSHENKINEAIRSSALQVTFFELEHTLRHLIKLKHDYVPEDLKLIPPKEKILKNNLGPEVEKMIQTGMLMTDQVEQFLNQNTDMDYAGKLTKSFVEQYRNLVAEGYEGDELFYALLNIASNGNSDVKYMAAGLNVLAYYFQLCEVFKK